MRTARIKADGAGYYHVISRAIDGRFIFGGPGHRGHTDSLTLFRKTVQNSLRPACVVFLRQRSCPTFSESL